MDNHHNQGWYYEYAKAFGRSVLDEFGLVLSEDDLRRISDEMYRQTNNAKVRKEMAAPTRSKA